MVTGRCSKLTRAVRTVKISATQIAIFFLEHWNILLGISNHVLIDNCSQIVITFLAIICGYIGVKHLTTTAYHPQTYRQLQRYNKTIAARLRHYIADHQRYWNNLVQPLTSASNTQVQRGINNSPHSMVIGHLPPEPSLPRANEKKRCPPKQNPRNDKCD